MAEGSSPPLPVPPELQRGAHRTREEWLESGRFSINLLGRALGRDLADVDLLDVGCGTKLTKTILDESLAIGTYCGVDVADEVVSWLKEHVSDPRFEFHRLDAHNDMYRPDGEPLSSFELLPVGPRRFDAICLFSVFTHLAPHDFEAMLHLLRRHAKPTTTLLFSLFIESRGKQGPRFVDVFPERPLRVARYDEDYALELVDGSGWDLVDLRPPVPPFIQHYMICHPAI